MTETTPANYQTQFVVGPFVGANGYLSQQAQRFMLTLYNRTGSSAGVDMDYEVGQINLALFQAQAAQKAAAQAEDDAQTALTSAAAAQSVASSALAQAATAEKDAQSAMKAAEDVLIVTLLTSSAQVAKTAQSLDDAALMAAQSQIWPSQLL